MADRPGGVFVYDSLDKANADTKKQQQPMTKVDWRIAPFVLLGALFLFIILLVVHTWAWNLLQDFQYRSVGIILLAVLYSSFSIVLLFGALSLGKWFNYKANRANLINVMEHQTTQDLLHQMFIVTEYFKVQNTRAEHSTFAGAGNLTYSPTHTRTIEQVESPQTAVSEEQAHESDDSELPLEALAEKKYIGRSGNSLLIGFGDKEQ